MYFKVAGTSETNLSSPKINRHKYVLIAAFNLSIYSAWHI